MKVVVDRSCNGITDALDFGELLHASVFDRFSATKVPEQLTAAFGAHAGNVF